MTENTNILISGEITGLNTAPSISGTTTLPSVNEGSSPPGVRVADLLAGTDYADFDPADPAGIAVVSAGGFGGWQYSTNGSTWTYFPELSGGQALLLDADSQIRFRPSSNFITDSASLSLRAWDHTYGVASTNELPQLVDATTNGGNTAFSSGLHTVQLAVIAVNDAPHLVVGAGKVTAFSTSSHAGANNISHQADGKIVLAGPVDNYPYGNADFGLARFSADGSLDTDFGNGGRLTTSIRSGNEWAEDAAIQQDGKIVATGYGYDANGSDADIVLVRYDVDGSLDASFSGDGKLTTDLGSNHDSAWGVAIQSDGRILVAGARGLGIGNTGNYDFALLRYNADGTPDASFNGNGVATTDFAGRNDSGHDLVVLDGGKILVAGTADAAGNADFALARYNTDGSLDTNFGVGGKLTTDIAADHDVEYALAIQADGKILLAGTTGGSETRFALARYNADGSLDAGFGSEGIAITAFRSSYAIQVKDVVLQNDGKILVSGYCSYYPPIPTGLTHVLVSSQTAAVVARYNPDGSLDTGFASAGFLISDAGAVASLQPDGKILVAGYAGFALDRYDSNGLPDTSFGIPVYPTHGSPVVLDSTASVHDEELGMPNISTGNYAGASLTLARHGGADMHDAFSASGNLGPLTPGAALTLSGTPIGTVNANAGGTLILGFDVNASQALVNETLSSIAYANNGDTPPASVQIDWTFNDGNNSGAQGSGGSLSVTASTTVNIVVTTQTGTTGDDTLNGTPYADTLSGSAGRDTLSGAGGNDSIIGGPGNDVLIGGAGNDDLAGGAGFDIAQQSGNRADYTIARGNWYHYTVTDNNPADGLDGVDTIFGIEQLQFADTTQSLQTAGSWHGFQHRPITPFWAGTDWQVLDSQRDFDGNGKNDLLLHKPDGSVALWLMDGAERVPGAIFDPVPGRSLVAASIDYNGDGKTDLGWREADGSNSYWLMGSGWAQPAVATPTIQTVTTTAPPTVTTTTTTTTPTESLPPPPVTPPPPPPPDGWW